MHDRTDTRNPQVKPKIVYSSPAGCAIHADLPDFVLADGPVLVWGTATSDSSDTAFAVPSASNSGDHTGQENGHGLTSTLSPVAPVGPDIRPRR